MSSRSRPRSWKRSSGALADVIETPARRVGRLALALAGLTFAIVVPACSGPLAPEEREFERNLAKWRAAKIEDYRYRLQRSCFCGPDTTRPVLIAVLAGIVIGGVDPVTFEPIEPPRDGFPTIEDLFEEIRQAIETADALDATYDGTLGYPVSVSIDYLENAIDDEMAFDVSEFVLADPRVSMAPEARAPGGFGQAVDRGPTRRSS